MPSPTIPSPTSPSPNLHACSHGLCSRNAILPQEDPAGFRALPDGLREFACAEWRLRRAVRTETGIFTYRMEAAREVERPRPTRMGYPHSVPPRRLASS